MLAKSRQVASLGGNEVDSTAATAKDCGRKGTENDKDDKDGQSSRMGNRVISSTGAQFSDYTCVRQRCESYTCLKENGI